ncbi:hypothetical protein HN446_01455 [bacterium]|jgi:Ser-tRNA(Ala) deacylase AlaX|nr:hypothetical protein [bacterium]
MSKPTKLLYMTSNTLESTATLFEVIPYENKAYALIVDQTIFYPQGGGQPYDIGKIIQNGKVFNVESIRLVEGVVYHSGSFESKPFEINKKVELIVNKENRNINSKSHSAGHLIDCAMLKFHPKKEPGKGFHFPDGAYVEYLGTLEEEERNSLKEQLAYEVNQLIQKSLPIVTSMQKKESLANTCQYVPKNLPDNKPIRIVQVQGFAAHPCGGTHVENTTDLGNITITKVKNKKGNLRVSYRVG